MMPALVGSVNTHAGEGGGGRGFSAVAFLESRVVRLAADLASILRRGGVSTPNYHLRH